MLLCLFTVMKHLQRCKVRGKCCRCCNAPCKLSFPLTKAATAMHIIATATQNGSNSTWEEALIGHAAPAVLNCAITTPWVCYSVRCLLRNISTAICRPSPRSSLVKYDACHKPLHIPSIFLEDDRKVAALQISHIFEYPRF